MPRFNVDFSEEALSVLSQRASERGVTKAEHLRHCIALLKWWRDTLDAGSKIVVERSDGRLFEVVSP